MVINLIPYRCAFKVAFLKFYAVCVILGLCGSPTVSDVGGVPYLVPTVQTDKVQANYSKYFSALFNLHREHNCRNEVTVLFACCSGTTSSK